MHVKITVQSSFTDNFKRLHGKDEPLGITTALSNSYCFRVFFAVKTILVGSLDIT